MRHAILGSVLLSALLLSHAKSEETGYFGRTHFSPPEKLLISEPSSIELRPISALTPKRIRGILGVRYKEQPFANLRGKIDLQVYKAVSPSVVIVLTEKSLGSGSLITPDKILTNWHVVEGYSGAGVIFKPAIEGAAPTDNNLIMATVVKFDPLLDLALLQLSAPASNVVSIPLGDESDIQIGADVHAIGHPSGDAWTYTTGIISQYRKGFEWTAEGETHKAGVIQTQTPINPGNSGGPLLTDSGKLIGVNSFKESGEGLNFAVSVPDVQKFLAGQIQKQTVSDTSCQNRKMYEGRENDGTGSFVQYDTNCDGKADAWVVTPDDQSKPILALIDQNYDGKIDTTVEDRNRDGKWDISFHDVDFDGKIDLIGLHSDGKITPTSFETYVASRCNKNTGSYDSKMCP